MNFSIESRKKIINRLRSESFDVLIIGGGITGAGIALDASARGLKTALVEQYDFAFGTSSRSTKLIHGGLRYLKQLEFALVKEVGSERAIVHQLAPHLVVPEKMLLPLYEKRGLGYWLASLGLKIYDLLAGVKREDQRRMLTKLQTINHEPLLKPDDIKAGAIYAEYRTDDARLTIEIAKRAFAQEAMLVSYVQALDFIYVDGKVSGVKVKDLTNEDDFEIRSKVVVNAAGPWVDSLRKVNRSLEEKFLHLTKGVHIVVPYHRLPVRQAIYFDVPDGRMVFAIPRGRITYVGTTDSDYEGSKEDVRASAEDVRYLIDATNQTFPAASLTMADVESTWAGLRPLIHEEGKSASQLSRKDEIFESESGLISIAGGKLTGYRKMAERVVDLLIEKYFDTRDLSPCITEQLKLAGGKLTTTADVAKLRNTLAEKAASMGLKGDEVGYLVHLYGASTTSILDHAITKATGDPELDMVLAKLDFCLNGEMVVHADDFFVRRTGLLYFDLPRLLRVRERVIREMGRILSWSPEQIQNENTRLDHHIESALGFRGQL